MKTDPNAIGMRCNQITHNFQILRYFVIIYILIIITVLNNQRAQRINKKNIANKIYRWQRLLFYRGDCFVT